MVVEIEQIADGGGFVSSDHLAEPRLSVSERWSNLLLSLEHGRVGRAILSFMRWGVVVGLVATGFFGAAAVSNGVKLVRNSDRVHNPAAQQILAASQAK